MVPSLIEYPSTARAARAGTSTRGCGGGRFGAEFFSNDYRDGRVHRAAAEPLVGARGWSVPRVQDQKRALRSSSTECANREYYPRQRALAVTTVERELAAGGVELGGLWRSLLAGEMTVVGTFSVAERSFAVLARGRAKTADSSPTALDRLLLERVLGGECCKALAAELRISLSCLKARCGKVLGSTGCEGPVSRTSPLLSMAALAAKGLALGRARVDGFSSDAPTRWLISVTNPAESLRDRLTQSEYEVARATISGKRHSEIAFARGTSTRTVANQLASIFRKLHVSGRSQLRALAIQARAREH